MRKIRKNKSIIILLMSIIAILLVLCILFATKIINFKESSIDNKDQNNKQQNIYKVNNLNVQALKEYQVFDDISNNKNIIEEVRIGNKYFANLDINGQVTIENYINDEWITGILNITNVIDIIKFDIPADESEQLLYLLTDKKEVYWYRFGDADNKSFIAKKVDTISNVEKLFISRYSKENAGGSWALFAITKNNDCIMLKGESV